MSLNFGQSLFPPRGEIITSYDYFDIAEGVGYVVYYGAAISETELITVTNTNLYSALTHIETSVSQVGDVTYSLGMTKDFDITFNQPRNVKGRMYANVPVAIGSNADAGTIFKVDAVFIHFDGSTETTLGTGSSVDLQNESAGGQDEIFVCMHNQTTIKHFKAGETLRIRLNIYHAGGTAGNFDLSLGLDPRARDDQTYRISGASAVGTEFSSGQPIQLNFHIPFKLDI